MEKKNRAFELHFTDTYIDTFRKFCKALTNQSYMVLFKCKSKKSNLYLTLTDADGYFVSELRYTELGHMLTCKSDFSAKILLDSLEKIISLIRKNGNSVVMYGYEKEYQLFVDEIGTMDTIGTYEVQTTETLMKDFYIISQRHFTQKDPKYCEFTLPVSEMLSIINKLSIASGSCGGICEMIYEPIKAKDGVASIQFKVENDGGMSCTYKIHTTKNVTNKVVLKKVPHQKISNRFFLSDWDKAKSLYSLFNTKLNVFFSSKGILWKTDSRYKACFLMWNAPLTNSIIESTC